MSREPAKKGNPRVHDLKAQLQRLGYGPNGDKPAKILTADELRKRFAKKRQRKPDAPVCRRQSTPEDGANHQPVVYQRSLPRPTYSPGKKRGGASPHVALEAVAAGNEITRPDGGTLYMVRTRVRDVEGAADLADRFRSLAACPSSPLCQRMQPVLTEDSPALENLVFMDIETTGLASSPLFLIGAMLWNKGDFEVRQFLARNYAEERPVLHAFLEECLGKRILITFNGKSFDWPYIRTRAAANGIRVNVCPAHLDLLHVSRRIWRCRLPNCKLQTLERFVCRRRRQGDIPGADIPDAYHDFVRTENAWQMVDILKHNRLDLVTLADIMTRFPDEC